MTAIEWTDETWNPTVGCSRVSPGCDHCYAIRVAGRGLSPDHVGLTERPDPERRARDWTGEVRLFPERLDIPLRWRKPRRVFVDSMSDLFHPDVPEGFIGDVWNTMGLARQHTFQVLTKRPQRMAQVLGRWDHEGGMWRRSDQMWCGGSPGMWPLPNVWLGTSVENQRYADLRIPHLLATPAAVRFLSIEPLLGPVDIEPWLRWTGTHSTTCGTRCYFPGCECACHGVGSLIDWVIVGGESGPGARPMHPRWVRDLRDQCTAAGVPFFFKQWGEWAPADECDDDMGDAAWIVGGDDRPLLTMRRVGKKAAGRELDGRTWDELPSTT